MKKSINKKLVSLIVALIAVAIVVGVSIAYFTKTTEAVDNVVTVGKVDVELTEPNWNPEKAKNIEPNQEIEKDPTLTNKGTTNAYVYLKVKVPKSEVILVLDNQLLSDKKNVELFTYNVNSGWEEIQRDESNVNYNTYVYAYTNSVLEPNASTSPVFSSIKFKNVLEGQLDTSKKYIVDITGYAIQSDTIKVEGASTVDKMRYVYNNYLEGAD